jgi:hypothetical protein
MVDSIFSRVSEEEKRCALGEKNGLVKRGWKSEGYCDVKII